MYEYVGMEMSCSWEKVFHTSRLHHLLEVHTPYIIVLRESKLIQEMTTIALKGFNVRALAIANLEGSCGGITLFATTNKSSVKHVQRTLTGDLVL